jgi:hypothetical protein
MPRSLDRRPYFGSLQAFDRSIEENPMSERFARVLLAVVVCVGAPAVPTFCQEPTSNPTALVEEINLRVKPPVYDGMCPADLVFAGDIAARGPGKVEYKIISSDGTESPVWTAEFATAGRQPLVRWGRRFEAPPPGTKRFARRTDTALAADHFGWHQVVVVSPEGEAPSPRVEFAVYCRKQPPKLNRAR